MKTLLLILVCVLGLMLPAKAEAQCVDRLWVTWSNWYGGVSLPPGVSENTHFFQIEWRERPLQGGQPWGPWQSGPFLIFHNYQNNRYETIANLPPGEEWEVRVRILRFNFNWPITNPPYWDLGTTTSVHMIDCHMPNPDNIHLRNDWQDPGSEQ